MAVQGHERKAQARPVESAKPVAAAGIVPRATIKQAVSATALALSPDCLQPWEIAEYHRTGDLSDARAKHVRTCEFCSIIVPEIPQVPEEEVLAIAAQLAALCAGRLGDDREENDPLVAGETLQESAAQSRGDTGEAEMDVLLGTLPAFLIALVCVLFLRGQGNFGPDMFTDVESGSRVRTLFLILLTAATALATSRAAAKWAIRDRGLRHSVGALAAGIACAAVLGWTMLHQGQSQSDALQLADEKVTNDAFRYFKERAETGNFENPPAGGAGPLFTTASFHGDDAVYSTGGRAFPGKLVAELTPTSGRVTWMDASGHPKDIRAEMTLGKVKSVLPDGSAVVDLGSETKTAPAEAVGKSEWLHAGSPVAVLVQGKTRTALRVERIRVPQKQ